MIASLIAGSASTPLACVDVGDSTATPGHDSGVAMDGTLRADVSAEARADAIGARDARADADARSGADAVTDSGAPDTPAQDTSHEASLDGGVDARDATVDSRDGAADAPADGPGDSGADGGTSPCTTAGQIACVPCEGNASGVCSPTEALFVEHDIAAGLATVDAGDSTYGCYSCLYNFGCLDDTVFGDTGHECGDVTGPVDGGGGGLSDSTLCLDTARCILSTSCIDGAGVSTCYCGVANEGSACASAGGAVDGLCLTQEVDGLGFPASDNKDILSDFTTTSLPTGMANVIFQCASANSCSACLPP